MSNKEFNHMRTGLEIAVIGMSGRFPGAKNIDEFWNNVKNGVESISFFSNEELIESGIDPELLKNPNYVKAGGFLENIEYFDSLFFNYTAREAEIMDPQFRLLHECSWEALEVAGYNLESYNGIIGVYVGGALNHDWIARVLTRPDSPSEQFEAETFYNRNFLGTRVSYKLGLNGPSFTVQTACSTSLVAIHLACQGLIGGECDIALAGGVSVVNSKKSGYLYQDGMIVSPDGHCRAFDSQAKGSVFGDGIGVVVLKPLENAITDGDCIFAIIGGSAINNDGNRRVGYTAPGTKGEAAVIKAAYHAAEVKPESISYIETHGTGTSLGDFIEIEALKRAFSTNKKGFCAIGTVKTNVGHLNSAAGVAGFIKTVLALKYRLIPPTLHFTSPNPKIDFENSPFYINTKLTEWKNDKYPLRAGVSSFGIGGTNAHVVLEEAPDIGPQMSDQTDGRKYKLILLSAKTPSILGKMAQNLADYFKNKPDINLADAAYTLQVGRRAFQYRRMLVCSDVNEAIEALSSRDSRKVHTFFLNEEKKSIVFVFPGLGAQYVNMGLDLYRSEPVFREEMNRCFEILTPMLDYDIKEILYPQHTPSAPQGRSGGVSKPGINQPEIAQIVIFIFEYALAKLLIKWGIKANAMIGYSFGEYVAACLSGVFSLEDALNLVVLRSRLIKETPVGAMLSVPIPKEKLKPLLKESDLSLSIDNGPSCVVSGPTAAIDAFEKQMKENRYVCVRLKHASRAIHSHMMEPILKTFEENLSRFALKKPHTPYISNLTGQWAAAEEVTQPAYWATHLRKTVRFADGIKELLKKPGSIFVEVGPGYDLSVLIRHHVDNKSEPFILNLVNHARSKTSEKQYLLSKIGRLWLSGVSVDWSEFYSGEKRYRISLPTYPFERQRYWIDWNPFKMGAGMMAEKPQLGKKPDIADWFYIPSWKRSILPLPRGIRIPQAGCWLVFIDESGLGARLVKRLNQAGQDVIIVRHGLEFKKVSHKEYTYTINPRQLNDYHTMFKEFRKINKIPDKIVHFWNVTKEENQTAGKPQKSNSFGWVDVDKVQDLGFYSLLYFAQASGKQGFSEQMEIVVVSNNMQRVTGEEKLSTEKSTLLGSVKVIPKEYTNITCRSIDVVLPEPGSWKVETLIDQILTEFSMESPDTVVAYRGDYRWVQILEPMRLKESPQEKTRLKEGGVYLIIGGLGGIGFVLAEHLAKKVHAKLVLTGRSAFPAREDWEQWLLTHEEDNSVSQKIKKVKGLERIGAEVLVCSADVVELEQMRVVITQAEERFGRINGVIHSAGLPDGCVIPLRTREATDRILAAKVKGTLVLDRILKDVRLDFFVNCSSINAILGTIGQVGYCAANTFQDAFAYRKTYEDGIFTLSINWSIWQEVGFGVEAVRKLVENENITDSQSLLENGILPSEGAVVFDRLLNYTYPQVVVSTQDLISLLEKISTAAPAYQEEEIELEPFPRITYPRPHLATEYVPPKTEFEKMFADILQKFFGFDRVGIHDNFFEYGVTSLTMIHINSILMKKIKKDIPIVLMFEYPTIHSLEQYLEQGENIGRASDKEKEHPEDLNKVKGIMHDSINLFKGVRND